MSEQIQADTLGERLHRVNFDRFKLPNSKNSGYVAFQNLGVSTPLSYPTNGTNCYGYTYFNIGDEVRREELKLGAYDLFEGENVYEKISDNKSLQLFLKRLNDGAKYYVFKVDGFYNVYVSSSTTTRSAQVEGAMEEGTDLVSGVLGHGDDGVVDYE